MNNNKTLIQLKIKDAKKRRKVTPNIFLLTKPTLIHLLKHYFFFFSNVKTDGTVKKRGKSPK